VLGGVVLQYISGEGAEGWVVGGGVGRGCGLEEVVSAPRCVSGRWFRLVGGLGVARGGVLCCW